MTWLHMWQTMRAICSHTNMLAIVQSLQHKGHPNCRSCQHIGKHSAQSFTHHLRQLLPG
jgi:hypothetical protein